MWPLIRKEMIVQKKMILFGLGYSVFLFFVFANPVFQEFTYSMAAFGIAYITVIGVAQAEYKNNSDIVINSLPLTRREVVAAKYLSILTFTVIALVLVGVVGLLFHFLLPVLNYRLMNSVDVFTTTVSIILLASVSLPIYFKTSAQWTRVVNVVVFLVLFFAPAQLAGYLVQNSQEPWVRSLAGLAGNQNWLLSLTGLAVLVVIILISYFISLRIYLNKDF
ncbi:MAG: ABC-2 transporter permease [Syntrophomonadaceae bacterium]